MPRSACCRQASVPGWSTTASDGVIELWSNVVQGRTAFEGRQFAELNAFLVSTFFQNIATTPGQVVFWRLAHRGRLGVDTMALQIGAPGQPPNFTQQMTDGNTAWGVYTGTYTVPAGQTLTRFAFVSVSAAGGSQSVGNFLDGIFFGTPPCDLVAKSVTPTGPVLAGAVLTYQVTVTNGGGDLSAGTVLTDDIPAGTTYVPGSLRIVSGPNPGVKTDAAGDDQAEYDATNNRVVVRLGTGATATLGGTLTNVTSLPTGTAVEFQVVTNGVGSSTAVANTASVAYQNLLAAPAQNLASTSNTVAVSVLPAADLAIAKISDPKPYIPGAPLGYAIAVTNNGPSPVSGAAVTDTVPAPLAAFTWSCATCSPSTGTGAIDTSIDLAAGESATIMLTGVVSPGTNGAIVNTATVVPPAGITDPAPGNNASTDTGSADPRADVSISKTSTPSPYVPGNPLRYTFTVANNGPSNASGIRIQDVVPADLSSFAWTCASCTPSSGMGDIDTVVDLTAGQSVSITLDGTVPSSTTSTITNTATVAVPPELTDLDPGNNASTDVTTASPRADLLIAKSGAPDPYVPGGDLTYTIAATNNGPSDVVGARVQDLFPPALAAFTWSCATCLPASGAGSIDTTLDLAAGQTVTLTIGGTVPSGTTGMLTNTATVLAPAAAVDPIPENNTSINQNPATPKADLVITKSGTPAPYVPGLPLSYPITVTNRGPSDVTGARVQDTVPAVLDAFTWSCPGGAPSTGTGSIDTLVDLPAGQSVTITLAGTVPSGATATLVNIATVAPPPDVTDPSPGNNSATSEIPGRLVADLAVTKDGAPKPYLPGTVLTYTITVANNGPSDVTAARVQDVVPSELGTFTWSCPGCAPSSGAGNIDTTVDLKAGQRVTLTLTGTVAPSADVHATLTNSATVTPPAGTIDPVLANNNSADVTALTGADLVIVKTGPARVEPGDEFAYVLRVANNGPDTAASTVFTDAMPAGVDVVSATASQGSCSGARTITCTLGIMLAGTAQEVTLTVRVRPTAVGTLINTASVTSATPDVVPSNNTATAQTTVGAQADLSLTKTVTPAQVAVGRTLTYLLMVTNEGPATATNVTVTDPLPAAVTPDMAMASPGSCALAGQVVTCSLGDLAPAATGTVIITATRAAQEAFSNTATVRATEPDPDPGNDSATATMAGADPEICGNCVDDDQDGLVDAEDPACCTLQTLSVTRVRFQSAKSTLQVKARLADGAFAGLDPRQQALQLQLRGAGGESVCCTIPQEQWTKVLGGTYWVRNGLMSFCSPIKSLCLIVPKAGPTRAVIVARSQTPSTGLGSTLDITLSAGDQCVQDQASLRPTARGGAVFP